MSSPPPNPEEFFDDVDFEIPLRALLMTAVGLLVFALGVWTAFILLALWALGVF